jgi:hypothetical protein
MKRPGDRIRKIFNSESLKSETGSRETCPSPEELVFSFNPEASTELKQKMIDHISTCPACQREFELVRGSQKFIQELEKKVVSRKSRTAHKKSWFFSSAPPLWKAISASVLLLAVLSAFYFGLDYWNNLRIEREAKLVETPVLTEDISWPGPAAIKLSWESPVRARFYRVEVFDQSMYLLWQSPPLRESILELPDSLLDSLKDYQYFFWQLVIFTNEKRTIESRVRKVRLLAQ